MSHDSWFYVTFFFQLVHLLSVYLDTICIDIRIIYVWYHVVY